MNCSQIFCTFAVETTLPNWVSLRESCELLSNFLYFCSRNNESSRTNVSRTVVNCSQIFCTFAVETTSILTTGRCLELWIALKFFVLLQSKQRCISADCGVPCCELLSNFLYFCSRNNYSLFTPLFRPVVNCSQIFCTFAVETTILIILMHILRLWIALKFFVLLQSKQPLRFVAFLACCCELLSNFLYFCSRNNRSG